MTRRSTLWLAGLLAVLTPVTLPAQVQTMAVNPNADVHVWLRGDGLNGDAVLPVDSSRLEIQMGDWVGGYRQFMLTRLVLLPRGLNIGTRQLRDVGIQLRSGLSWWGRDISDPFEAAMGGNYEIDIPSNAIHANGDPLFVGATLFKEDEDDDDPETWEADDRVIGSIKGYINLARRRYYLRFLFRGTIKAPWWAVWADDVRRTFWVRVWGEIPESRYMKLPPDPIVVEPVVLQPGDDPDEPPPPPDPFERDPPVNER